MKRHAIADIGLRGISWAFSLLALICALLFYFLSPYGHGISIDADSSVTPSLIDCAYFSIVTISSLGYGDLHPVGWGRIIASCEVLLGLVLIALLVSRLASQRQALQIQALHASEQERRLRDFQVRAADWRITIRSWAATDASHTRDLAHITTLSFATRNWVVFNSRNSLLVRNAIVHASRAVLVAWLGLVKALDRSELRGTPGFEVKRQKIGLSNPSSVNSLSRALRW